MLFNSWEYIFYLAVVTALFFALPQRARVPFLLVASYYFYMQWDWKFAFLIGAVTLVNWEAGRRIADAASDRARKAWLWLAVAASLGVLFFFKYYNFFNESFRTLFEAAGLPYMVPYLPIILPVGISFFTFQALSYPLDVYRGDHGAERSLTRFAAYVVFFPQLVAGPIERASTLLDQFSQNHRFSIERLGLGAQLIVWGLFKKVVIADRLGIYVDEIYAAPELHGGSTLLLATYFFAVQIYCDFSAYSDIAIGSAWVLGFQLSRNFALPYLASSIADFWRRWHITLTTWFRSYVYYPLGGNRVSTVLWMRNIWVVFLVSGVWHGAAWTFVIWGALHAAYYVVQWAWNRVVPAPENPRWWASLLGIVVTFHAVVLAWVFFRAENVSDAWLVVTTILSQSPTMPDLGASRFTAAINLALVLFLLAVQVAQAKGWFAIYLGRSPFPPVMRAAGSALLVCGIALLGASSGAFIYFQF